MSNGSQAVETTHMFREAHSAAEAVRAQLRDDADMARIGAALQRLAPRAVVTCARGSSDHAATYAKYLIETRTGVLTASAAPSISSVYGVAQDLGGCLFIAISQSGRSPDLLASVDAARRAGAVILALCNHGDAPLMRAADLAVELRAGLETSVAATKSYLASLAALLRVVAYWQDSAELRETVQALPALMERAWDLDWSPVPAMLRSAAHLYVVGRGLGLGAAQETALKLKETSGLHAEAFSSAELRHGPFALLGAHFPALLLAQPDATLEGVVSLAAELARREVPVLLAGAPSREAAAAGAIVLPSLQAPPEAMPILLVQSAYRWIASVAVQRGFDPDRPPNLRKVTETV